MFILHLSNTPLSNAPENLAEAQRQAGHRASLLLSRKSNLNKVHVGGCLWSDFHTDHLALFFHEADVIHMHNFAWEQKIFQTHPELVAIAKTKRCLIQYHSPRHTVENFETTINDPFFKGKRAVIAQYHPQIYPECEHIVPNVVPIFNQLYTPIEAKWDDNVCPTVSYAPSNITGTGWDDKGYRFVNPVLQKLEREGRITRDVMIGVPYEECMTRKRWAHIGIDEFVTGSYHMSSLEYMSMGCALIGRISDLTREAIAAVAGVEAADTYPAISPVLPENFEATIRELIGNGRDYVKACGMAGRLWMENYWNPRNHVKQFEKVYDKL